jgi:hypothetical protein
MEELRMKRAINLTPHPIVLMREEADAVVLPSEGICRVSSTPGALHDLYLPVPVANATEFGEIEGLPEPQEKTWYIVSGMVASALVQRGISRPDVLVPGTGPNDRAVRDAQGRIIGVTRLVRATA